MTQYLYCFLIALFAFFSGVIWHGTRSWWRGHWAGQRSILKAYEDYIPCLRRNSFLEGFWQAKAIYSHRVNQKRDCKGRFVG